MHDLPPELREALKGYKDPYGRDRNPALVEVLEDWRPIFACLDELHRTYPDWRFGQMIANLTFWASENDQGDTYSVPDESLVEAAQNHLAKRKAEVGSSGA